MNPAVGDDLRQWEESSVREYSRRRRVDFSLEAFFRAASTTLRVPRTLIPFSSNFNLSPASLILADNPGGNSDDETIMTKVKRTPRTPPSSTQEVSWTKYFCSVMVSPRQGMIFPLQAGRDGRSDLVGQVDRGAGIPETKPPAGQHVAIYFRMKVGEAVGELEFLAAQFQGPEGAFAVPARGFGKVVPVQGQEPLDPGFFELEEAGHLPAFGNVDDLVLEWSENPEEHIKEVDADVRPHAAGLLDVAFPGDVVPASAGRNVGQLDIAFCI